MKQIVSLLVFFFYFTQCSIFKPSNLDPREDLGTLQSLLRLLALADAFNTQSQSVVFMKFTDSSGTPYAGGAVEYSVFNEADENGVATSDFGETGNVRTYTATLDNFGRGFLFFSERGIAKLNLKNAANTFVGTADFRIYNGINKQSFSLLNQTGNAQFLLEDLANYRNRLATNFTFTPLGSANGRQFIFLQVQTTFIATDINTSIGYIASSADGEYYDSVTRIDGVTIEKNVTYEIILKISKPVFNGSEYIFFLSEEKRDYSPPNNFQSNKNLAFRISSFSAPSSAQVSSLPLASNLHLFRSDNLPWMYPVHYFNNGKYVIPPRLDPAVEIRPTLLNEDLSVNQDMISGFFCNDIQTNTESTAYQIVNANGLDYIHCPNSALSNQVYQVRSIDGQSLSNRVVNFDAGIGFTFQSPPMFVRGKFIAMLNASPSIGYTFNLDSYTLTTPTLTKNTNPISGLNPLISSGDPLLRAIRSSNNADYLILSNIATFAAPTVEIFRSTDDLVSVTAIPAIPSSTTEYSTTITNAEQLQSFNGLLNYSYAISASNGSSTLPVYFTRFTKSDGTWEDLPRLIKIK
ncbi:hypothetical protein EHQ46_12355 [Leptospira yanagawae]|uniref:Uncharacterized protein n=1 Tax=Leptospira yanagawae TaxID=293069 RepID=A0ABY2M4Q5_9LEPT|nr:hypothetical protein [Leptospira yanagawae]TGL20172.1 hypothetical protein EHQ46_12355 [Leptospira yanagawae]